MTIYPGRASPTRRMPPRTLPGSMERHREVCRKNLPEHSSTPSSNSSAEAVEDEVDNRRQQLHREEDARMISTVTGVPIWKNEEVRLVMSSSQLQQQQELLSRSPPDAAIIVNRNHQVANGEGGVKHSINTNTRSAKRIVAASGNNEKRKSNSRGGEKNFLPPSEDSEDFSDDSLEDTSLPPPPPPPVVPPPPSLSCPVTPNKRGSIAWEINLDEPQEQRTTDLDRVNGNQVIGGGDGVEKVS